MSLTLPLSVPLYTGSGTSTEVPSRFPVSLNGRPYIVDSSEGSEYRRRSLQMIRQQADTADKPGEQTLNPEGLWRRAQESWHKGSGQNFLDRADSDPARFRSSKGVDPWTEWELSLLPDTTQVRTTSATNLKLVTTGDYVFVVDGTGIARSATGSSWTALSGTPGGNFVGAASDGTTVYLAHSGGVYKTNSAGTSVSSFSAQTCQTVGYARGRLLISNGATIYTVNGAGTATSLFVHDNADFRWVGFSEGPGFIYTAGSAGDKSLIYRIPLNDNATALTAPIVAGRLPDGEIIRSLNSYLGFLLIGTTWGIRLGAVDASGEVTLGNLIPTSDSVYASEGQDRFVWYGRTNYDATSTGLSRLDLRTFTATLTPAYATDLMATGQGTVSSVVTWLNKRIFTVNGLGVWQQSASKVGSGTLNVGGITYGITDDKVAISVNLRHQTLPSGGSIAVSLAADGGTASSLGSSNAVGSTAPASPLPAGQVRGETFTPTFTLTGDVTLNRWDLRAYPSPNRGEVWYVPLILDDTVETADGPVGMNPKQEMDALRLLYREQRYVTFQEGTEAHQVVMADYSFKPEHRSISGDWCGTFTAVLKEML